MMTLFLAGDVMTGRGIDQALPNPSDPHLREPSVRDARDYVALAEAMNGPIPRSVNISYIWGIALRVLDDLKPDARIVNLETSVTQSSDYWPDKGIHYRMHPRNVDCLTAAGLDCCVLANNHVLDFGYAGFRETLETLRDARLAFAGAGRDGAEAAAPAVVDLGAKGRVLVFALGCKTSGIPFAWSAGKDQPGINLLSDLSEETTRATAAQIAEHRRPGDVVVASIHWGGNWGYAVPRSERAFAHALIDRSCVDCVHGHSSHHAKGIEIYRPRRFVAHVFRDCGFRAAEAREPSDRARPTAALQPHGSVGCGCSMARERARPRRAGIRHPRVPQCR
jgi:poly-gamma-glutamate synthesis protein (capsule biosynthesis protein)